MKEQLIKYVSSPVVMIVRWNTTKLYLLICKPHQTEALFQPCTENSPLNKSSLPNFEQPLIATSKHHLVKPSFCVSDSHGNRGFRTSDIIIPIQHIPQEYFKSVNLQNVQTRNHIPLQKTRNQCGHHKSKLWVQPHCIAF